MNSEKIWSIFKGALIALGGFVVTALETTVIDFGPTLTPIMVAVNAVIVNAIRKYLEK